MKPIPVRFQEFKTRHNLTNKKIAQIATEYAYSHPEYARTFYSKANGISEHVFYKILEFAIITRLVDEETQGRIFSKLCFNNLKHGSTKENVERSRKKREQVLCLQKEYLEYFNSHLDSFSNDEIIKICKEFSEGISMQEIARNHTTSVRVIRYLLDRGMSFIFDIYTRCRNRLEIEK